MTLKDITKLERTQEMLEERSKGQAGQALQNAQLFAEREACREGVEVLLDIARALASTMELKQVLKIIAQRTAQAVGAERCSIDLWRQGHVVPVMSQFADEHTDRKLWEKFKAMGPHRLEEVPVHAEAIRTKQPVVVEDATSNSLVPAYWLEGFGIRSALVVPLIHQDEVIGTLNLDRTTGPYAWRQDQIDLAMTIANQAALAVENARLYGETQRHLRETQSLLAVGQAVGSTLELTEILRRVTREVARLLNADMVGAYMADPEGLALRPMAGYHVPAALVDSFRAFPIPLKDHPFLNEAWESKKPVFSSDAAADLRVDRETLRRFPYRSMLFVPVVVQDAPVGGLCAVWWEQERHFTPVETCLVEAIGNQAAVAVANARLYEEARGARDFLQSITENSADAIVTTDLKGRITYFSPRAEEIFGYRSEEILGQPVADYYRSGLEEARAVMQRLRAQGQFRNYETAVRAKDGRWVEASSSLSLLRDASGAIVGTVGILKDITDRKRAEQQLRLQGAALESAANVIVITDRNGTILWINPAFTRQTGYTAEEAVGQTPRLLKSGKQDRPFYEHLWQTILAGRVWSGEIVDRRKDGSLYTVEMTITPVRNVQGEVTHFIAIKQDITERKQAEALKSGQNQVLELLATGSPLATVLVALVRTVEEQFHGIRCSILLADEEGKRLRAGVAPSLPEEFTQAVDGLEIGPCAGSCGTAAYRRETVVVEDIATDPLWADFRELALGHGLRACWSRPILATAGQVLGTICIYYPEARGPSGAEHTLFETAARIAGIAIERKRAEDGLRQQEEQLRQASKLAAVGQLVGGVAHEINNPLAVIVGYAERLRQLSPDPRVGERAGKILASAKRAARIIQELQSFVRPQPRQLVNVHLPEVLEHTLRLREQTLRVSGIRVEQDIAPGLPPVRGDFGQLEQVVLNLLLNAEQAVAGNGEQRSLMIRLTAQGDRVRLAVADSGPGIPPDIVPRIFEPFFTTKPVGQGTGLGLSICYGIVQAHGGRIWAESRPGHGATVIVELPANRAEGTVEAPPAALPPLRRGHVLVVEDEDDVAEAFRELLESLGQEVTVAAGGEAGWERLKGPDAPYDVVTLDLKMPDLSGQTLWEQLVAHGIPLVERVVFVTGDTADPETQWFLDQAGRPVLTKPVEQATFATLLAEWLAAS